MRQAASFGWLLVLLLASPGRADEGVWGVLYECDWAGVDAAVGAQGGVRNWKCVEGGEWGILYGFESAWPGIRSIDELKGRSACELDAIFAAGDCVAFSPGFVRGHVLALSDDYRLPRLTIRFSNRIWQGKHFYDDGYFINQFVGFRALSSYVATDLSWFDGRPCVVLQYPPGTPFFAPMRDEVRRVGANVFLSRVVERRSGEYRGFIAMQPEPGCFPR